MVEVLVEQDDVADGSGFARGQDTDLLTDAGLTSLDRPREPTEVEVWPIDPLDRESERVLDLECLCLDRLQESQQRWPLVPLCV